MQAALAALKAHARLARAALEGRTAATPAGASIRTVRLGATEVRLRITESGAGGPTLINVHENEHTSVEAARQLMPDRALRLVELQAQGRRLVSFRLGVTAHSLDPNRIFTEPGLAATLATHGPDTNGARQAGRALRDAILATLPPRTRAPLIALHNNDGSHYSIRNFAPGASLAADAARVHAGEPEHDSEFFIVTEVALFEPLAEAGFNVVLQAHGAADDGSLSVWAQREHRPYVNVEARHGRLEVQRRMIDAALALSG